jgi:hypothetical protein
MPIAMIADRRGAVRRIKLIGALLAALAAEVTADPHPEQHLASGFSAAPHELQKAITIFAVCPLAGPINPSKITPDHRILANCIEFNTFVSCSRLSSNWQSAAFGIHVRAGRAIRQPNPIRHRLLLEHQQP